MNIQIALQGGGAKLVDLLAVAEVFQEYQREGLVTLNAISGTSAGAIAGSFLAAGIPISKVRESLKTNGPKLVSAYRLPKNKLKRWWMFRKLRSGTPLWNTSHLEDWLDSIFSEHGITTIAEAEAVKGTSLSIVAANLGDRKPEYQAQDKPIVNALLNSAGLPYLFKTWSKSNSAAVVDGGICDNLPVDGMLSQQGVKGPVVAVTFRPTRSRNPDCGLSFSLALLDTAISHGVRRSVQSISPDSVLEIATPINTFDFDSALRELTLDGHYGKVMADVRTWLDNYRAKYLASKSNQQKLDPWMEKSPATRAILENVGEMYCKQHLKIPLKYQKVTYTITCNEAFLPGQPFHGTPDIFKCELVVSPADSEHVIPFHGIGFSGGAEFNFLLARASVKVSDCEGRAVDVHIIPMATDSNSTRDVLLSFDPMLSAKNGPYHITFEEMGHGFMGPLLSHGRDVIEYQALRSAFPIPYVELILHLPKERIDIEFVRKTEDKYPWDDSRLMTPEEISLHNPPCASYRTLGWVGKNISHVDKTWGIRVIGNAPS